MIKKMTTGRHAGEYQVRIQPVNKLTHKRESWPVQYAKTKRIAKAKERKMWTKYQEGFKLADGNSIFAEQFRKFVDSKKETVSKVTYRDWDYSARVVEHYFGAAKIKQINTQVISDFARKFVKEHEVRVGKSSAIERRLTHLHCYFQTIVGTTISKNPVPPKPLKVFFRRNEFDVSNNRYIFSNNELKLLKNEIIKDLNSTDVTAWLTKLAIWIDLETGMRPGEIQALRFRNLTNFKSYTTFEIDDSWSDYSKSFNGSLKSRPHGTSRRCLPLSKELVKTIQEFKIRQNKFLNKHNLQNPEDLIFLNIRNYKTSSEARPINQRSMNQMLDKLCKKLNIKTNDKNISLYSFRHTACTKLANSKDISNPWAADRMGNSLWVFCNVYVKSDRDLDNEMVKAWLN